TLAMTVGLVLALAACFLMRPSYRASATIMIEQQNASGLLGDLSTLTSLGSAPATASELSVLESRTLAERVMEEGADEHADGAPLDERRVGLCPLVDAAAVPPAALAWRAVFDRPPPDVPLALPERGLSARVTASAPDSPARVRIEFPA